MKKVMLMVIMMMLSGVAMADRYSDYRDRQRSDSLRYNVMENRYSYEPDNASLQYNVMENKYEYVRPGESLRYNAMEDRFEYAR